MRCLQFSNVRATDLLLLLLLDSILGRTANSVGAHPGTGSHKLQVLVTRHHVPFFLQLPGDICQLLLLHLNKRGRPNPQTRQQDRRVETGGFFLGRRESTAREGVSVNPTVVLGPGTFGISSRSDLLRGRFQTRFFIFYPCTPPPKISFTEICFACRILLRSNSRKTKSRVDLLPLSVSFLVAICRDATRGQNCRMKHHPTGCRDFTYR